MFGLALFFLCPAITFSSEPKFLFTEDQNIKSHDFMDFVPTPKDIASNKWMNSPPTRIELISVIGDRIFKESLYDDWIKVTISTMQVALN
jgi:hypothetical protein